MAQARPGRKGWINERIFWSKVQKTVSCWSRKGRAHKTGAVGSCNGFAKLTEAAVVEIRQLVAAGMRYADVAAKFNVSTTAVGMIVRGVTWKHVGAAA